MILLIAAAVILPIALALAWRRLPGQIGGTVLRIGMILGCQAAAVLAVFAAVNRVYMFYDSWDELLGHQRGGGQVAVTDAGQLVPADGSQGRISILTVHGKVSGATEQVLIWFPPQYADPAEAKTRFPVLMALPGQPGTPAGNLQDPQPRKHRNAGDQIRSGKAVRCRDTATFRRAAARHRVH
jgi:hypothetical protein